MLKTMNMRRANAPPYALADYRVGDADALAQPLVERHSAEQKKGYDKKRLTRTGKHKQLKK